MIFITSFQLSELQKHLNAIQSIINCAHQQTVKSGNVVSSLPIRAMSKAELAALAGVSPRTFATWLQSYRNELRNMGVKDRARFLPAKAVAFICEQLVIT